MDLDLFFKDKTIKPSERANILATKLADNIITIHELLDFAAGKKEAVTGSCIEAIEHVTKTQPGILDSSQLSRIIAHLSDEGPRVKWESARVTGNVIAMHPEKAGEAMLKLLENTNHEGTVVRWSAAFALAQIMMMKTEANMTLLPAIATIIAKEEKNSIKNIYLKALKKCSK